MPARGKVNIPAVLLFVLGAFLLIVAASWRWLLGPALIKLPLDLDVESVFDGEVTYFADPDTATLYPEGESSVMPVHIVARDRVLAERSSSRVALMEEKVTVTNLLTGEALQGVRPDTLYALDRRTCENVSGFIEGLERTGYTVKLPMLAEKKTYALWDDELGSSVSLHYLGEDHLEGDKYSDVRVFTYRTDAALEKMAFPPPGLPESITGREIKQMTGNDSLPLSDESQVELEYFKSKEATLCVEPYTGIVVRTPEYRYAYYVKNAPGTSPTHIKLAEVSYSDEETSSRRSVDGAAKYLWLFRLDLMWVPLGLLVAGSLVVLAGAWLLVRGRRRDRGGPADRETDATVESGDGGAG